MKLRPRLSEVVQFKEEQVRDKIQSELLNCKDKICMEDNDYLLTIRFKKEFQKLWTPQMEITFEDTNEGLKIRGSIGPSSSIWLVFSFLYFGFSLGFIAALFYGLSQYYLNHPSVVFLSISAIMFLAIIGLYLVSFIGQSKSKKEISYLSSWFNNLLSQ